MSIYHRINNYSSLSSPNFKHTYPHTISRIGGGGGMKSEQISIHTITETPLLSKSEILNLTKEEEEKRSDELQKILLETIPMVIRGVENLGNEVDTICSAETLVEKRSPCEVLVEISKLIREYPRGMGYRSKVIPAALSGKPKLISFRSTMDQVIWEIISKLSILKDFVEFTLDLQKLYIIAICIREAKNSFINHHCEQYIKSRSSSSVGGGSNPTSENTPNSENNENSDPSKKLIPKQQPVVLSRAPKQVTESTRLLVDTVVNRKFMYKDINVATESTKPPVNPYSQVLSDRINQIKEDPKKYKLNLLQQRRSKLVQSDQPVDYDDVNTNNNNNRTRGHQAASFDHGHLYPNIDAINNSTSPPKSPPKSPELPSGVPQQQPKKRSVMSHLRHTRSFSDSGTTPPNGFYGSSPPPLSPRVNEKVLKYYKLLSSSPSSSSSNVHFGLQSPTSQDELEWEDVNTNPLDLLIQPSKGFKIDQGHSVVKALQEDMQVLFMEDDEYYYRDDFTIQPHEHHNFLGRSKNGDLNISISVIPEGSELLFIIRTGEKDERVRLSLNGKSKDISSKDMIKMIKKSRLNQLSGYKFKEIKDQQFVKDLLDFESKNIHRNFKIGVLYCKDEQGRDENEIYSNSETSVEFQEFLKVLGEKVPLQGWTKYRGGLDIKDNTTGTHSIYRKWRDYELMFHVAPMIPCRVEDEQSVERKRHLGNDICLIIFKEGNSTLFDPSIIKSNFNHIIAVVQVDNTSSTTSTSTTNPIAISSGDTAIESNTTTSNQSTPTTTATTNSTPTIETNYKVSVACKDDVGIFGPSFPKYHTFSSSSFTDFLLAKLINGEKAALRSPVFSQKLRRTRKEFLQSYIDSYYNE
ncbi:RapGAP/RanGAP domain-containing protein [Tieghemostelium lacteum]|uniref:RapGAP/RanGAP domain-containing protein n=1 Tax=Tieghemostelium lacteum TaxID=361077 RepID=A0A151ZDV2_TIELA|nr:RapGAP/RanGAP domain-containing protein [Tieghemostelium lacteum]|eukprot:KYQ92121.1 RapGAP/RanGAP domain-containing protein [Tieghemostelium lacteum]